jgi:hypothetical protein
MTAYQLHEGHWTFHPLWVKLGLVAFGASFLINAVVRALLYLTVADMVTKPTGADTAFLAAGATILVVLAAVVLIRMRPVSVGTTSG